MQPPRAKVDVAPQREGPRPSIKAKGLWIDKQDGGVDPARGMESRGISAAGEKFKICVFEWKQRRYYTVLKVEEVETGAEEVERREDAKIQR